jgi:hypothetical protein
MGSPRGDSAIHFFDHAGDSRWYVGPDVVLQRLSHDRGAAYVGDPRHRPLRSSVGTGMPPATDHRQSPCRAVDSTWPVSATSSDPITYSMEEDVRLRGGRRLGGLYRNGTDDVGHRPSI